MSKRSSYIFRRLIINYYFNLSKLIIKFEMLVRDDLSDSSFRDTKSAPLYTREDADDDSPKHSMLL